MALTTSAPVPVLARAAARVGWADALGEVPACGRLLTVLCARVNRQDGTGRATVRQLMREAGYRHRGHASRSLARLESLGIITWTRGYTAQGGSRRVPSTFRVSKTALLALIRRVRPIRDEEDAQYAAQAAARTSGRRFGPQNSRSLRVHSATPSPPLQGETPSSPPDHLLISYPVKAPEMVTAGKDEVLQALRASRQLNASQRTRLRRG